MRGVLLWWAMCALGGGWEGAAGFLHVYPRIHLRTARYRDAGQPLYVTPYLERGNASAARDLARVPLTEEMGVPSYSGFFTVNEKFGSNQFFWYFPPTSKNKKAPVILWLQGGPGGTSLFGLFAEIGPIKAIKGGFATRNYHWALDNHVIFIDNPVGTGFSCTTTTEGYCQNETCVGNDLYQSIKQFFIMFPNLRKNEFYITGESYAGKYIPAIATEIHNQNKVSDQVINLKGLAMGNGYCDPINQLDYGKYLYGLGLIDTKQRATFEMYQNKIVSLIKKGKWLAADLTMDNLMDGDMTGQSYFQNVTGFKYYYNFLKTSDGMDIDIFAELLARDDIRKNIHVGNLPFNTGLEVEWNLKEDMMQSVAPLVSKLLNNYRVMTYNGQLDIIVAYPLTENFLKKLNFSASEDYKNAKRNIWKVDGEVAGYYKTAGLLTEVLVRDAGHMVPADQPKWALDLITRFTRNKPLS